MRIHHAAMACLTLLSACGDSGGGSGSISTTFSGILSATDGLTTGALSLSIATASPSPPAPLGVALVEVNVTGTLTLEGSPAIPLTGTYETTTGDLIVTGGGYTLTGVFNGVDRLEGTFTGPGNSSGGFVVTQTTTGTPATTFCGSFARDDQQDAGTFSIVIRGNSALGRWASSVDGATGGLEGTLSGNSITITVENSGVTSGTAVGTRSGSAISGTFTDIGGGTGTWQGAVCQ